MGAGASRPRLRRKDRQIGTSVGCAIAFRDVECRDWAAKPSQFQVSEVFDPCNRADRLSDTAADQNLPVRRPWGHPLDGIPAPPAQGTFCELCPSRIGRSAQEGAAKAKRPPARPLCRVCGRSSTDISTIRRCPALATGRGCYLRCGGTSGRSGRIGAVGACMDG
jgi:hypothetical protein